MQRTKLLLSFACLSIAAAAQAQTQNTTSSQPLYAQMGYSFLKHTVKTSNISVQSDMDQVTATVGYQIHPRVAVEGLLGLGVSNKQATAVGGTGVYSNKINNMVAVFIKPQIDITDQFSVHGRVGYSQAAQDITIVTNNTERKVGYTTSGVAYGLGANYAITPNLNFFVDYYVLGGNVSGIADVVGNADFRGFNIGLGYKY